MWHYWLDSGPGAFRNQSIAHRRAGRREVRSGDSRRAFDHARSEAGARGFCTSRSRQTAATCSSSQRRHVVVGHDLSTVEGVRLAVHDALADTAGDPQRTAVRVGELPQHLHGAVVSIRPPLRRSSCQRCIRGRAARCRSSSSGSPRSPEGRGRDDAVRLLGVVANRAITIELATDADLQLLAEILVNVEGAVLHQLDRDFHHTAVIHPRGEVRHAVGRIDFGMPPVPPVTTAFSAVISPELGVSLMLG